MRCREYQTEDFPVIQANLEAAGMFDAVWDSQDNVEAIAAAEHALSSVRVLERDDQVAASVYTIPWGKNVAFFYRLCVATEFQGRGYGSQLLSLTDEKLRVAGAKEVAAFYDSENIRLARFYERRGYRSTPGRTFTCIWKD